MTMRQMLRQFGVRNMKDVLLATEFGVWDVSYTEVR